MPQLIPTIHIQGESLPEVWEKSILATWHQGMMIPTQYDKPGDPNSRDVTALLVVNDPLSEPRFHRNFPGGLYDLEKYVAEVVDGVLDHQIDMNDPQKWHYTYHDRLEAYPDQVTVSGGNQLSQVLNLLADCPFTRRAQAITWDPTQDLFDPECPCLQRLWFRVLKDDAGQERLCMSIDIRSNDAYKGAFMNMYAFVMLQARMAWRLSERLGREILVGQYTHYANSYHLYGSYFEDIDRFVRVVESGERTFAQRTWTTQEVEQFGLWEEQEKVRRQFGLLAGWPWTD